MYVSISYFLGYVEGGDPRPLLMPVRKGQQKCGLMSHFHVRFRSTSRMFKIPTPFLLYGQSLPSLCPPLLGYVEEMEAPADRQKVLFNQQRDPRWSQ